MNKYLIWSEEHEAWWRPNNRGYTTSMKAAGKYSYDEACAISYNANGGGTFCEVPVEFTAAMRAACELPSGGR